MIKGIVFVLIFGLFISRLIPKYVEYRETNIVSLLGVNWQGYMAILILLGVLILGVTVLVIGIRSFYQFFNRKSG